jgi:hypothetical protein
MPRPRETRAAREAEEWRDETAERFARGCYLLTPPWRPIATIPRDGREVIVVWLDIDDTWNLDLAIWSDSNRQVMTHNGSLMYCAVGWIPRPPLPGPARLP